MNSGTHTRHKYQLRRRAQWNRNTHKTQPTTPLHIADVMHGSSTHLDSNQLAPAITTPAAVARAGVCHTPTASPIHTRRAQTRAPDCTPFTTRTHPHAHANTPPHTCRFRRQSASAPCQAGRPAEPTAGATQRERWSSFPQPARNTRTRTRTHRTHKRTHTQVKPCSDT